MNLKKKLFEDEKDFEDFVNFATGMAWVGIGLFVFAGLALMVLERLGVLFN